MKQVLIYCSPDLSEKVHEVLVRAGAECFIKLPHAVGTKPGAAAEHGRYPHWQAEVFMAPVEPETAGTIVTELQALAGSCEYEPCLRILVSEVEAVY